ncbi:DUF1343 domain-containing protein [Rubellicoccus peritrichatus]|uniref:DUF1343 domain-containing protein n=1 Tax=Rubellicoccus peritrichatus TaxID=3080537 RepID=A0AAQ3QWZ2_9BACT|nr:DUF1343 domain-containing protein [Puniceicoccus sp. CR14]WOO42437.1 DUF1343 domain-containing protein [Puniceicoccus sp. CR14]
MQAIRTSILFIIVSLVAATCFAQQAQGPKVMLGIDVLEEMDFKPLKGRKVGLLTHPAGVNRYGKSTIDILNEAPGVDLVALYGPEHGIDGKAKANEYVSSYTDPRTGLPVYSLYNENRKPKPEMLKDINVMVIDLQDLGVRSYTYVSAMRKTIEACFEAGIPVVILDRPNPLGGLKVDGPPLEAHLKSYVGAYRVPYVHGLTIGELAKMSKQVPGVLEVSEEVRKRGKLYVIPMKGWTRDMKWPDTGLGWVPTSPAIPDLSAALGYSMSGLGAQLGDFSHGYGSPFPFRLLNHPAKTPQELSMVLDGHNIAGLKFKPVRGVGVDGKNYSGVYVILDDWDSLRPTELSFHMMRLAAEWSEDGNPFRNATSQQKRLYKIHVGSEPWWTEISSKGERASVENFIDEWTIMAKRFQDQSKSLWLYK